MNKLDELIDRAFQRRKRKLLLGAAAGLALATPIDLFLIAQTGGNKWQWSWLVVKALVVVAALIKRAHIKP